MENYFLAAETRVSASLIEKFLRLTFCVSASDLESIRALFNEKEKELSVAVAKVEELTLQLEELQRGRGTGGSQVPSSSAAIEVEKLRAELLVSN